MCHKDQHFGAWYTLELHMQPWKPCISQAGQHFSMSTWFCSMHRRLTYIMRCSTKPSAICPAVCCADMLTCSILICCGTSVQYRVLCQKLESRPSAGALLGCAGRHRRRTCQKWHMSPYKRLRERPWPSAKFRPPEMLEEVSLSLFKEQGLR